MTIDLLNSNRWNDHPLTRLYLQIVSNVDAGFNRKELIRYFDYTLEVAKGERFRKQKIRGIALKMFTRLDSNHDNLVCIRDMFSHVERVQQAFAPTDSLDNTQIIIAAQRRFNEICKEGFLDYPQINDYVRFKLPISVPFRGLISQTASLIVFELAVPNALRPLRSRYITEAQWVKTALELRS